MRHRTSSRFLFWTALGLLAVACLNAAGLAAARNVERQGQLLVCRALGASMGDLARLQLVEDRYACRRRGGTRLRSRQSSAGTGAGGASRIDGVRRAPTIAGGAALATVLFTGCSVLAVSVWPLFCASRFGLSAPGRRAVSGITEIAATRRRSGRVVIAVQVACGFAFVIAGVLTVASLAPC